MYRFVQNLQKKNERQKKAILVSLTAISAAILGGIWLFTLENKLSNNEAFVRPAFTGERPEEKEKRVSVDIERPFASLKDTAVDGLAAIKEQFDTLKNAEEIEVEGEEDNLPEQGAWELPTETQ